MAIPSIQAPDRLGMPKRLTDRHVPVPVGGCLPHTSTRAPIGPGAPHGFSIMRRCSGTACSVVRSHPVGPLQKAESLAGALPKAGALALNVEMEPLPPEVNDDCRDTCSL